MPVPGGHDEFSQLLLADTFAHGRLTNPAHPMWIHFESFHIIHQPTYSSIYPPAQGLVLAAGQLLGHPWIGELVITALMCAAICWMLQGWLPPKWALFGAVLAVLRLGVFSYWMDGYWATSVVALGGALLLGALPRITRQQRQQRQQRIADALWLALGLAILANTRPYEGLVLAAIVGAALLIWMLGPAGPALGVSLKRIVAPAGCVAGGHGAGHRLLLLPGGRQPVPPDLRDRLADLQSGPLLPVAAAGTAAAVQPRDAAAVLRAGLAAVGRAPRAVPRFLHLPRGGHLLHLRRAVPRHRRCWSCPGCGATAACASR